MKSPVTKFMNCFILRGHQIRKEDLYVRDGKVLNPEPFFYDEKKSPDVVINCKGCLIAPGTSLVVVEVLILISLIAPGELLLSQHSSMQRSLCQSIITGKYQ